MWRAVQVPRLQSVVRDRRANWAQSIATLEAAKTFGARVTKTSIMLGCGESIEEVQETLKLLRASGASLYPIFMLRCRVNFPSLLNRQSNFAPSIDESTCSCLICVCPSQRS